MSLGCHAPYIDPLTLPDRARSGMGQAWSRAASDPSPSEHECRLLTGGVATAGRLTSLAASDRGLDDGAPLGRAIGRQPPHLGMSPWRRGGRLGALEPAFEAAYHRLDDGREPGHARQSYASAATPCDIGPLPEERRGPPHLLTTVEIFVARGPSHPRLRRSVPRISGWTCSCSTRRTRAGPGPLPRTPHGRSSSR
jgi:hypothetical protein